MMFTDPPESAGITMAVLGTKDELDEVLGVLISTVQITEFPTVFPFRISDMVAGPAITGKSFDKLLVDVNIKEALV